MRRDSFGRRTSCSRFWTRSRFELREGVTLVTALASEELSSDSWTVPHRWATPRTPERPTYGPVVAAVSEAMGRPFMPHQREYVDVVLEVQAEEAGDPEPGEWAYDDSLATWERRAGKTATITPIAAHRARKVQRARMFMTAQNRDKARKRWLDVTDDLLASPLRSEIRRKIGNMNEQLRWPATQAILEPFAPNEEGLHSETPDVVFVDELWAFSEEQRRAIQAGYVPAFATSSGQAFKYSTQGTPDSAWLNSATRAGRLAVERGVNLGVAYFEHSLPDIVDGKRIRQLTDEELIEACIANHPAVCHWPGCPGPRLKQPCEHGFTVRPAAIRTAWDQMDDRSEFLRAYGNRSAADVAAAWRAIEEPVWLKQIDPGKIPPSARISFGVWLDEDGEDAAVAAGWRDDPGKMHTEHLQLGDGYRWVYEYVTEKAARNDPATVAIANVGAARDLADELEAKGVPVLRVGQADVAAASTRHRSELRDGTWFHALATPATAAAKSAGWEKSGGGYRWTRPGESISALGAQTMAGWGIDHAPAPMIKRKLVR
jgi:hypothetical protein